MFRIVSNESSVIMFATAYFCLVSVVRNFESSCALKHSIYFDRTI